jgi:hypothetical protein
MPHYRRLTAGSLAIRKRAQETFGDVRLDDHHRKF